MTTTIADYFDSTLRDFLKTLFERVVITSTQVEMQFAKMSLWTAADGRGPRMCLPTLASQGVLADFVLEVDRWRRELADFEKSEHRSRPAWTTQTNPGSRTNHIHVFMKDTRKMFREESVSGISLWKIATQKFSELNEEAQARYRNKARLSRAVAAATPRPIERALSGPVDNIEGP